MFFFPDGSTKAVEAIGERGNMGAVEVSERGRNILLYWIVRLRRLYVSSEFVETRMWGESRV